MYTGCLKEAIENTGNNVSTELEGNNPDQDFYYMGHAKRLIVSTGGYLRSMGKMVQKGGGVVIGRVF
jgi:hypothetical protein